MLFQMHFCQMRICDNKWVLKSVGVCTLFHTFCIFSKLKVVELKLTLTLVSRSKIMVEIFSCFLYKLSELQRFFFGFYESIYKPSWRNWLARSAVNRKVGGSSPPGGDILFWKQCFIGNFFFQSLLL